MSAFLIFWSLVTIAQIVLLSLVSRKIDRAKAHPQFISFGDDYFFLAWNAFCALILLFFVYFTRLSPEETLSRSFTSGGDPGCFWGVFVWLRGYVAFCEAYRLQYIFFILIAIKAAQVQFKQRKSAYWWAEWHSRFAWGIRLFVVVVNVFLLAMISWRLFALYLDLAILLDTGRLVVDVYSPDLRGGLTPAAHLVVVTTSILLIRGIIGCIGAVDHMRGASADRMYLLGDAYNIVFGLVSVSMFVLFAGACYRGLQTAIAEEYRRISDFCGGQMTDCGADMLAALGYLSRVLVLPFESTDITFTALIGLVSVIVRWVYGKTSRA